uniref:Uncharacterized protein n=1 Tax=Arundo donax TaxID=35708 RepID=A0A0A9AMQ7_ARUDO
MLSSIYFQVLLQVENIMVKCQQSYS